MTNLSSLVYTEVQLANVTTAQNTAVAAFAKANSTTFSSNVVISVLDNSNAAPVLLPVLLVLPLMDLPRLKEQV